MMPYRYTSVESITDAAACAKALGVSYQTLPIEDAVAGLTKALALEGRGHHIACSQIDIGNAATELARQAATTAPSSGNAAPEPIMDLKHVSDAVLYMANLPLEANVLFMTLKATEMPFEGRG